MKKQNSIIVAALLSIFFFLQNDGLQAQAGWPFQINNSCSQSIDIEYHITVSGTTATYGPFAISPCSSWSIPLGDFSAVGYSGGLTAEVEVVVMKVNSAVFTGKGGEPIASSWATSGVHCFTCFAFGNFISSMAWFPSHCDIN